MAKFDRKAERKKLKKLVKRQKKEGLPKDQVGSLDLSDVALKAFDFFSKTDKESRKAQRKLFERVEAKEKQYKA